jgi:LPXTG-motif cell wall-anchored protein
MTSPDGITGTTQTSAADNEWTQVAWGGPTGQLKFVAVASTGTGDRVMTSGLTASAPSAPTINSITSGDSSLTVSFTAAADGGSPIMNYKYSTDGVTYSALNPASTSSPFTISGLTNGTAYSVTIKAVNAIGDSVASNIFAGTPTTTTVAPKAEAPTTMPTEEKAQSLPVTGDDSLNMVFIGLFFVIGGIVFSRLRRIV